MRYHFILPREQQPRKNVLRTIDGHIAVPIPPSQRSTQDKRSQIQKKAEEATEIFPARDKKTKTLKDSLKRAKKLTKRKDGPGSSKDSVNSIYHEPNIFVGPGNLLQFPGSIAHCVLSDFQMRKGIARQISSAYPCMRPTLQSVETPIVGS